LGEQIKLTRRKKRVEQLCQSVSQQINGDLALRGHEAAQVWRKFYA
jgi:hypothetical protein